MYKTESFIKKKLFPNYPGHHNVEDYLQGYMNISNSKDYYTLRDSIASKRTVLYSL